MVQAAARLPPSWWGTMCSIADRSGSRSLAARVVSVPAFRGIDEKALDQARALMESCRGTYCCLDAFGPENEKNRLLAEEAEARGKLMKKAELDRLGREEL